jgi:hypothetical protein
LDYLITLSRFSTFGSNCLKLLSEIALIRKLLLTMIVQGTTVCHLQRHTAAHQLSGAATAAAGASAAWCQ